LAACKLSTHVTFDLPEGQILGLIGPNGAGKTTLFNAINGIYPPEEGRIIFREKDVTTAKTYDHARMGMARTHQIVQPLNDLTVRENVMVGACFGRENQSLGHATDIGREVLNFVELAATFRSIGWQPQRRAKEASGNGPGAGSPSISIAA
jgi:branched-chain amino acid transport system ATP-binding protein